MGCVIVFKFLNYLCNYFIVIVKISTHFTVFITPFFWSARLFTLIMKYVRQQFLPT